MSRLLKSGLVAGGAGFAAICITVLNGGFGPCGNDIGLYAYLAAFFCLPAGLIMCVAAGIVAIIKSNRQAAKSPRL
jgi:hypothetical protein